MKKKNIFLSMMLLVGVSLTSCNKDDIVGGGDQGTVVEGQETYATFRYEVEGSAVKSRANMVDEVNEDIPQSVSNIRLLIFEGNNGTAGKLLVNELIETGITRTVKTTSGSRRIYIMANTKNKTGIDGKLNALNNTSTLQNFYDLTAGSQGALAPTDDMSSEFKSELISAGSMIMSNRADNAALKFLQPGISEEDSQKGDATKNNFTFNVYRAVAKGGLTIKLKDESMSTADGVFKLDAAATFSVRNLNRAIHMVQQYASHDVTISAADDDHESPNMIMPRAPFFNTFDPATVDKTTLATFTPYYFRGYSVGDKANGAQDVTIAKSTETANASKTVYFTPNSNNLSLRGNTTYFGICVKTGSIEKDEIAASIIMDVNNKIVSTANGENYTGTGNFWYMREIPGDVASKLDGKVRKVFLNKTVAFTAMNIILLYGKDVNLTTDGFKPTQTWTVDQLIAAYDNGKAAQANGLNAVDLQTIDRYLGLYKDGKSYYRLNIYETVKNTTDRRHLVRRNHKYNAMITSFATIGEPSEDDLDKNPEFPVDADNTHVTAKIAVQDWHDVNMSDDM